MDLLGEEAYRSKVLGSFYLLRASCGGKIRLFSLRVCVPAGRSHLGLLRELLTRT